MKMIVVVLKPEQLPAVKQALFDAEIRHMTAVPVLGTATRTEQQLYRGVKKEVSLHRRVRLELAVNDSVVERAIEASDQAARLSPHDPVLWTILIVKALGLFALERHAEALDVAREATRQATTPWTAYSILAATAAAAGDGDEARQAIAETRRLNPAISAEEVRRILPFRDPMHIEQLLDAMRLAGMDGQA